MPLTVTPNSVYTFTDTADPNLSVGVPPYYPHAGSFYINSTSGAQFVCVDPTYGSQTWLPTVQAIKQFTPVIYGDSTAGTGTYTTQIGYFSQNGYNCFAKALITWTAHTGTGNLMLKGCPINFANLAVSPLGECLLENIVYGPSEEQVVPLGIANTNEIGFWTSKHNASAAPVAMSPSGTIHITMNFLS